MGGRGWLRPSKGRRTPKKRTGTATGRPVSRAGSLNDRAGQPAHKRLKYQPAPRPNPEHAGHAAYCRSLARVKCVPTSAGESLAGGTITDLQNLSVSGRRLVVEAVFALS